MKLNFKISYIYETIIKSENQFKEHIIQYGEESRPIVRNMLWINLRHIKEYINNTEKILHSNLDI